MVEIKGAIATIDAMGCQKHIADQIVKQNRADYVLALKKDQKQLYERRSLMNFDPLTALSNTFPSGKGIDKVKRCL